MLILLSLLPASATEKDSLLDCGKDKRGQLFMSTEPPKTLS